MDGAMTGGTNITISGELDAATLDISGNADIDGTLEADAYTVDGTALNEYIADTVGAMVSSNTETNITVTYEDGDNTLDFVIGTLNQDTTGTADNFTVSANNSTDETVYPIFVDGATGSQGAESDTGLTYNPSSGVLTATQFTGALSGNASTATVATTVTITDNESTNENNAIIFTAGGDVDGGNLGLESDGDLTYNPSTGLLSSTGVTASGTVTFGTLSDGTIGVTAWVDEDNMSSDSATLVPTQQSVKAYVDSQTSGSGTMSNFILEDDDGTEVTVSNAKEVKFIGSGITTNWTDTDNGTDGDPYDLTFTVDAAQTGITSMYATDLILGEDAETAIDFGTANEIDFKADNAARLTLTASSLYPVTTNQIDLGTASYEFKDAFFDGTVTADAFAGPLTGNVTGNVSGTAATVTGAAQSNITSVGTLTTLSVDNITVNGNDISSTDTNGNITVTTNGTGKIQFNDLAYIPQQALTSSSNAVAWDVQAKPNAYHQTSENTTFSAPTNGVEGAFICLEINYNGSHTIGWNTVFEFAASTEPTETATDGKTDIHVFRYNGAIWQEVGRTMNLSES